MDHQLERTPTGEGLPRRAVLGGIGAAALGLTAAGGATAYARPSQSATSLTGAAIPAADKDPVDLLKRMLSYDTQNYGEGGKTRAHGEWLKTIWENAGVPVEIIETPQPDNVHVIARIPGKGSAEPLLLLGHSDVVPVEEDNWDVDPFAGKVIDGEIYGRGALDMKGANSASISAMLRHLDEGAEFDRDIIVLTDCDEEAGSYGSRWLAEHHWDKIDAGSVLTEGGWFLAQSDSTTPMLITATRQDNVYFNIDITAKGVATHSSKPIPDETAVVTLSRAVSELGEWEAPVHLTDVTREYFEAVQDTTDDRRFAGAIRLLLRTRSDWVRERAARLVVKHSDYPYLHRALLRTTHAFVIEEAGYKENVIPSSAEVRVNCRGIPGGEKPRDFLAKVRGLLADRDVEVKLVVPDGVSEEEQLASLDETWATPPADLDTDLWRAMESATEKTYEGTPFAPALFEAGTSLDPWRAKGVPGYGVYPYVLSNEQLIGMHGNNERIFVEALKQGTDFMYEVFAGFLAK
ncbi:M20/M25/M40 family metallo-hydrolase [Janibacter cremeus]|uniref:Acetylornithine deacetylase/succinyl-diaminopimelate desuccinylase-like protein n=1 Tax=Janibacter cremeus TaxID=1285192 RepID=A0A852VT15_9MICO|nr:M20/M25/M40 family metallo-hydrolase [Janibacter cremeus]NYF96965.1 acetylornithine deacetylase/succinyl-diaminopimelate desuccinylase-like protein [Janibacter cremeus]